MKIPSSNICEIDSAINVSGIDFANFSEEKKLELSSNLRIIAPKPSIRPKISANSVLDFPENEIVRQAYIQSIDRPGNLINGYIEGEQFLLIGGWSLPFDIERKSFPLGAPVGWNSDLLNWYITTQPMFNGNFEEFIFQLSNSEFANKHEIVSLGIPGFDIYGHWILDMLARLVAIKKYGLEELPLHMPNSYSWCDFYLTATGLDKSKIAIFNDSIVKCSKVIIPTLPKSGYMIDGRVKESWEIFRDFCFRQPHSGKKYSEKIFLSRSRFPDKRRKLENISEIEELFSKHGFEIVYPEELSIPEQAQIIRNAKIIVGEDGSALHNIIFASSGTVLGVINNSDRFNLWHVGICELIDCKVAFCAATLNDAKEYFIEKDKLYNFVKHLVA